MSATTPADLAKLGALRASNNQVVGDPAGPSLKQPLLTETATQPSIDVGDESDDFDDNNFVVRVLNAALRSAARLANLLPTGTFLFFQVLVPIVSNSGSCETDLDTYLTLSLLILCGLLCLLSSLTDSFTTKGGKVHYGFVTWFGLWTPQLDKNYATSDNFKLEWIDVFHTFLSVLVFYTSTIFSPDVRYCFYPDLVDRTSNLVANLVPPLTGFVVCIIIILFPSKRHGVGYPVTAALLLSVQEVVGFDEGAERGSGNGDPAVSSVL